MAKNLPRWRVDQVVKTSKKTLSVIAKPPKDVVAPTAQQPAHTAAARDGAGAAGVIMIDGQAP